MKMDTNKLKKLFRVAVRSTNLAFKITPVTTTAIFILITLISLLPFLVFWIDNRIIDTLIGASQEASITGELVGFLVIGIVVRFVVSIVWSLVAYFEKTQFFDINKYYSIETLKKLSSLDIEYYEDTKTNDLIQTVRDNYSWRPSEYNMNIIWIIRDIVGILTSAVIVFALSPWIFIFIFVLTVPSLVVKMKYGRESWTLHNSNVDAKRKYWDLGWYLSEERALFELKVYKIREFLVDTLKDLFNSFQSKEKSYWKKRNIFGGLADLSSIVGVVAGEIFVVISVIAGKLTVGQFSFYSRTFYALSESIGSLFYRIASTTEGGLFMHDIYQFFDLENKIADGEVELNLVDPPVIELKDVVFKYAQAEAPVFDGLNLTIRPGENIAIVGENGAGKSTLIKLLMRFYKVSEGGIYIDKVNINDLKIGTWYNYVSALFQDFLNYGLFSIRTNIELGRIENMGDKNRLGDSIQRSKIQGLIDSKPLGLEQKLSKRFKDGTDLSKGEDQRVALARAFYRQGEVLILDEPTSAIDAEAEAEIFDEIFENYKAKTVIIISHRFSTVRKADRILVMHKGKIVEQGTHKELLSLNGKYAKMFYIQAKGYV